MKKDCDKKAVRKDWIERVVVRLTMQRVMDEEKINRLIDAILVMQEQEDITPPCASLTACGNRVLHWKHSESNRAGHFHAVHQTAA